MNSKTTSVYWAPFYDPENESHYEFLLEEPKKLLKNLYDSRVNNKIKMQSCPAIRSHDGNIFFVSNPTNAEINLENGRDKLLNNKSLNFMGASPAIADRSRIIYDLSYIFFSDSNDPVIMSLTPPYLHKTESYKYGHVASGNYDISSWFRPISADFQLWEGIKEIKIPALEPVMYLHFNKKVELKRFKLTKELFQIAKASVAYKDFVPNQSLESLYLKFKNSKNKKFIIDQIKKNLMD